MKPRAPLLLTGIPREIDDDCACPDKAFLLTFTQETVEVDSDCACPDKAFRLFHECAPAEAFVRTPLTHVQSLPNNFYLAFSPYAPDGPGVLNDAAWKRWQSFAMPQPLHQKIDYQLAAQMLLQPENGQFRPRHQQAETLTAWLHVTNACNLNCPYCYVRKTSARMSEATGLQAVDQIFRTARLRRFKRVKLKYAGGEATLHFKLVRYLHEAAAALAEKSGLSLREVILSNGVHIQPGDADWIADTNVKLMVSLDGIDAMHD